MKHPFKVGQKVAYVNPETAKFHPSNHPGYRGIISKITDTIIFFHEEGMTRLYHVLNIPKWEMEIIEEPLPYKKGDIVRTATSSLFDGTPLYTDCIVENCFSFKDEIYICYDYQQRRWIVNVKDVRPIIPEKTVLDEEENTEI